MIRLVLALGLAALTAACGADGAPVAPDAAAPQTGIVVTGDAQIGVTNQ
jgi:hypothetical protein